MVASSLTTMASGIFIMPTSGIKGVSLSSTPVSNAHCGIYTLSGQKVAQDMNDVETLQKGVYIVVTKDGSRKIMK